jgi:hypothetical protein
MRRLWWLLVLGVVHHIGELAARGGGVRGSTKLDVSIVRYGRKTICAGGLGLATSNNCDQWIICAGQLLLSVEESKLNDLRVGLWLGTRVGTMCRHSGSRRK